MPTVLRQEGFSFRIYNSDHEPRHTHVWRAGKEVVIDLGDDDTKPSARRNRAMSRINLVKALRIAAQHQDYLISEWIRINGNG